MAELPPDQAFDVALIKLGLSPKNFFTEDGEGVYGELMTVESSRR